MIRGPKCCLNTPPPRRPCAASLPPCSMPVLRVDQDALVAAAVDSHPLDRVAARAQFLHHGLGDAALGLDGAAVGAAGRAGRRRGADVLDARRFAGLLHVHAEVDQVHQHLHVPLRLHVAAHDAEA